MRMRSIAVGATALFAATAAAVVPAVTASASASSSTGKVIITTKSYGHMDTTSASGTATFSSDNGPVWAIDSLNEKWTIVPCSASSTCTADNDGAQYAVTLNVITGSRFAEFADPGAGSNETMDPCPGSNPGGPHTGTGNVTGTIEYDIQSSVGPDLSSVPPVQDPNTGLSAVLGQIFDGHQTIAGGGHYVFNYSKVCGRVYNQTG